MVTSGWKEVGPVLRVVWKFASMENGGLCVMTHGRMTIPVWSVDNLVSHEMVRKSPTLVVLGGFLRFLETTSE